MLTSLLRDIASYGFAVVFVLGAIPAYLPQYLEIRKGSGEAFSTLVSFVLLLSNILRLFFWIGKRFELVLVYQSIVMLVVQLAMLEVCTRVRSSRSKQKPKLFTDFDWRHFWNWDDIASYILCMLVISVVVGVVSMFLMWSEWYVELLGFLALLIEATLGFPQLIRNHQKGTQGLSTFLISSWLIGDVSKTIYFISLSVPVQFTLCSLIQITVDCLIFLQIYAGSRFGSNIHSSNTINHHTHPHSHPSFSHNASPSHAFI